MLEAPALLINDINATGPCVLANLKPLYFPGMPLSTAGRMGCLKFKGLLNPCRKWLGNVMPTVSKRATALVSKQKPRWLLLPGTRSRKAACDKKTPQTLPDILLRKLGRGEESSDTPILSLEGFAKGLFFWPRIFFFNFNLQ